MNQVRLLFKMWSIQVRSQMQYRFSFWMDILSTMVLNGSYFLAIALVLERFENITGWTLGEVAFLAGMSELAFGTMDMLFSGYDPDQFSILVRLGRLDQYLVRPVNINLQLFGSKFMLRRLGRMFEGAAILAISFALTSIHWTLWKVIYLPIVFLSLVLSFGSLFVAGATLIFWTVQPIEAVNILTYGGNETITYPMTIYPDWLRKILTYAIPFIFLNYYPALYFLDKPDPFGMPSFAPFLAPAIAVIMLFLSFRFWNFGLAHYSSTGS